MLNHADMQINDLLVKTYQNIGNVEERMLTRNGDLTIAELHMMECVSRAPEKACTISGIAQALSITLPTVTVAIQKLEKKGYVVKSRDEKDGRVMRVTLTQRGRKMDAAHRYFHENMVRSVTREMDESEIDALIRSLTRLNEFFERKQKESTQENAEE